MFVSKEGDDPIAIPPFDPVLKHGSSHNENSHGNWAHGGGNGGSGSSTGADSSDGKASGSGKVKEVKGLPDDRGKEAWGTKRKIEIDPDYQGKGTGLKITDSRPDGTTTVYRENDQWGDGGGDMGLHTKINDMLDFAWERGIILEKPGASLKGKHIHLRDAINRTREGIAAVNAERRSRGRKTPEDAWKS